jgi:MoaD family protein
MSVSIRVPTPLRKFTDGKQSIDVEGQTVDEALSSLVEHYPDLEEQIYSDDGSLKQFVNVFANDEDIRFQEQLETEVSDGDEISIVPAIAGG